MLKNIITSINNQREKYITAIVFLIFLLAIIYRFYQPLTSISLTQFDIFDWAGQSKQISLSQNLPTHDLWVFPLLNSLGSLVTGIDLFYIYLFGGAVITTLNFFLVYKIVILLFRKRLVAIFGIFLYATMFMLLVRSIMYLPETLSFTIGLFLLYLYIKLFQTSKIKYIIPIGLVTYYYVHLHQSGLNFLAFSIAVIFMYILFSLRMRFLIRSAIFVGLIAIVSLIVLFNPYLSASIEFFFSHGGGTDIAFKGEAIPLINYFFDYHVIIFIFTILGALCGIFSLFQRQKPTHEKQAFSILLMICLFYFSFLYILPNLNIYNLVPWRFYTWFSLYSIFLASYGFYYIFFALKISHHVKIIIIAITVSTLVHGQLIVDDMYTADKTTIDSISSLSFPDDSVVVTTNANYLQTRYALIGKNVDVGQVYKEVFLASSDQEALSEINNIYNNYSDIYVLISLYQLQQRPHAIDYWRNAAYYQMDIGIFDNSPYFDEFFRDEQILVFQIRAN